MTGSTAAVWALAAAVTLLTVAVAVRTWLDWTLANTSRLECLTEEDLRRIIDEPWFAWPVLEAEPGEDA